MPKEFTTRDRLLAVAGRLFAARGYDAVSVRDITSAAQANLGAITYHFGSKAALFAEVVTSKTEPMVLWAESVVQRDEPPDARLRALLEGYATFVLHEDPQLKVLFSDLLAGGKRIPKSVMDAVNKRNEMFAHLVQEGIDQGLFRPCDVEHAAWCFFGMLSAYILYEPLMGNRGRQGIVPADEVRRIVDTAMDCFLNGLRRR